MPLKLKPTVLDRLKELEGDAKAKRISEALPILAKNSSKQLAPVGGGTSSGDDRDVSNFRDTIAVDMSVGYLGEFTIEAENRQVFKSDASFAELEYFGVTMQYILNTGDDSETIQYAPNVVLVNEHEIMYVFDAVKTVGLSGTYTKNQSESVVVPNSYHHGYCPMLRAAYLTMSQDDQVFYQHIYIVPKDFAFEGDNVDK